MSLSIDSDFSAAMRSKEPHCLSSEDLTSHIAVLRRYALSLVCNTPDADDLVQDCLVRALSRKHLFIPGTNLRAWLITILHNIFLDSRRKAKRTRELVSAFSILKEESVTYPNQINRIELHEIDKILTKLPAEQRSTLLHIAIDGLNYAETADVTGVLIGTVRSRLSRGRSALAVMMNGDISKNKINHRNKATPYPLHSTQHAA